MPPNARKPWRTPVPVLRVFRSTRGARFARIRPGRKEGRGVGDWAPRLVSLGGLGAIDPDRKGLLASLGIRSMVSGMLACFMTACFAGMLV